MSATQQDPLARLLQAVTEHDAKLNAEDQIPTGDDYNTLYSLVRELAGPMSALAIERRVQQAQATIDSLVEALAKLGFGDEDAQISGGYCIGAICDHFDDLALLASKRFLPPRFAELREQIKVGTRVLSVEGEMSSTNHADDVSTGPNAVGFICSIDDTQEHCIGLAFEPSEVSVVLSLAELADDSKYTINPDEEE